jgi:hypothetical protein
VLTISGHAIADEFCGSCETVVTQAMVDEAKEFTEQQLKEHRQSHYGTVAARAPTFNIPWTRIIPCSMHMVLRMYATFTLVNSNYHLK